MKLQSGKKRRTYNSKKKAVIGGVLTGKHWVKGAYIEPIDHYSAKSHAPIFEEYIYTLAKVFTINGTVMSYSILVKTLYNLQVGKAKKQKKSQIIVHQIKSLEC